MLFALRSMTRPRSRYSRGDVEPLLDEDLVLTFWPSGPVCGRDELHAEDGLGQLGFHIIHRVGRALTPPPFAAASGVDLRLHHTTTAELLADRGGFGRVVGDLPARRSRAIAAQDFLRLVLVDLQTDLLEMAPGGPGARRRQLIRGGAVSGLEPRHLQALAASGICSTRTVRSSSSGRAPT